MSGSLVANSTYGGNCHGASFVDDGTNLADDATCGTGARLVRLIDR